MSRSPLLFFLSVFALAGLSAAAASADLEPRAAVLALSDCRLPHPQQLASMEARCGTLRVLENPAEPGGRHIGLRVAVVPALNRAGPLDPLFVLAGGPGQAAGEFYMQLASAFAAIQRERSIVLVDQRGAGGSNALSCDFPDESAASQLSPEEIRALSRQCLAALPGDPRFYTTSVAVQDLERVRAALGYERINLYGISYGTRVAQHYLRRFPERVRAMILDGVVPPPRILGADTALQAQRALELIFARCRAEAACHAAFPDPAADFTTLRRTLERAPAQVSFPDPRTASVSHAAFGMMELQTVVRLLSYGAEQAAVLPLLLQQGVRGNLAPMAAQVRMIEAQLEQMLSIGMHNAVACTEDVPFFAAARPDREALARSYIGLAQLEMLEAMCSVWPRGVLDEDLHAALDSSVPALLLSGSADPVTPPDYAVEALAGLHHGVHLVLEGQGHGQLAVGCVPRLMAQFLTQADAQPLDLSCARETTPAPFFISFAGPHP